MRFTSSGRAGQALAEFALVFPIFLLILAGIIQFGLIFWAQNTLTQVARDTGRWAATQQTKPCNAPTAVTAVVATANDIAGTSSLLGYTNGSWTSPANVDVTWSGPCPPTGNQEVAFVTITLHHHVPVFFSFLPVSGDLTTEAEFRMEPASQ